MITATLAFALTLAGSELPEGFVAQGSIEAYAEPANGTPNENPWWTAFDDPALTRTIETALDNNYDLEAAAARILQAEAQSLQALAPILPRSPATAT